MGQSEICRTPAPFLTSEPVLAENFLPRVQTTARPAAFFDLLGSGLLEVSISVIRERQALWNLIRKYEDLPMSLADASLVRLAELHLGSEVLDAGFTFSRLSQKWPTADTNHHALIKRPLSVERLTPLLLPLRHLLTRILNLLRDGLVVPV